MREMMEITDRGDCIKLTQCEQLTITDSEIYNIYYSEFILNKNEIDDLIKLLQDYKDASGR
jgi:hypothetical protein